MYYMEAHAHLSDLSLQSLQDMSVAGIRGIVSPVHLAAFKPVSPDTVVDVWDWQIEKQLGRARQNKIEAWAMLGISMVSTPRDGLDRLLELLPKYLAMPEVVAVGEIGFEPGSRTNNDEAYQQELIERQLDIVKNAGVSVDFHVPLAPDKKLHYTEKSLELSARHGVEMSKVIIDHCTDANLHTVLKAGAWAAISVQPWRGITPEAAAEMILKTDGEQILVDSDSSDLLSWPLAVAQTAFALRQRGAGDAFVEKVCRNNCRKAYGIVK